MKWVKLLYLVSVTLLPGIVSCTGQKDTLQDDSPVTILVTHGFGEEYYETLAEDVKNEFGIEVEFVYENSSSITIQTTLDITNGYVPADLVFSSVNIDNGVLSSLCVDLLSESNITANYTYGMLKSIMADDGAVYQIPMYSHLVGITYNATLMDEMGWTPPSTFDEMMELKRKCKQAGIPFAIADMQETGHPFNWMFHLMGSQWLSTIKGDKWVREFVFGKTKVDAFKKQAEYFRRWTENGLFGEFVTKAGAAINNFSERRALLCYTVLNSRDRYDGPMRDRDGNETGKMLHDVYKTMPWISEDGSNNCFTLVNFCWALVNKDLLAENKRDKLHKVFQILEYMTGKKMAKKTLDMGSDIFLPWKKYDIGDDRIYSEFRKSIISGHLQAWYYSMFDLNNVVGTGAQIGSYMVNATLTKDEAANTAAGFNYSYNSEATFDTIFDCLTRCIHLEKKDFIGNFEEKLDYEHTARLTAISGGLALQDLLDGIMDDAEEVEVGLLPYATDIHDNWPWANIPVQNAVAYPGKMKRSDFYMLVPKSGYEVKGVRMSGREINRLVKSGFNPFKETKPQKKAGIRNEYVTYPYMCVVKGERKLLNDREYIVCLPEKALTKDVYDKLEKNGKVLTDPKTGTQLTALTAHGLSHFFELHPSINRNNITWK